jgi:hypothetical protein
MSQIVNIGNLFSILCSIFALIKKYSFKTNLYCLLLALNH